MEFNHKEKILHLKLKNGLIFDLLEKFNIFEKFELKLMKNHACYPISNYNLLAHIHVLVEALLISNDEKSLTVKLFSLM